VSRRKKAKPIRVDKCAVCGTTVYLDSGGWLVNGEKLVLCGFGCFEARRKQGDIDFWEQLRNANK